MNGRKRRGRGWLAGGVFLLFGLGLYLLVAWAVLNIATRPGRHRVEETPISAGMDAAPVAFETEGGGVTLRGFMLRGSMPSVIILLHGLDSNCWRGWHRDLAKAYVEHGYNVLVFSLRGHGDSGDSPLGLAYEERHDVRGAVAWLLGQGFEPGTIGIHGTSYGAATALIATAHTPEIAAVVSDSAFADFRDVLTGELARRIGRFGLLFEPALMWFMSFRFDVPLDRISPLAAVRDMDRPILFIHGEADARIPPDHTRRLIAASKRADTVSWFVPGATHAQAFRVDRPHFLKKVFAFFDRYLAAPSG